MTEALVRFDTRLPNASYKYLVVTPPIVAVRTFPIALHLYVQPSISFNWREPSEDYHSLSTGSTHYSKP